MKKFVFIVGIIILAGGIFIGGLVLGGVLDFSNGLLQVSMLEQQMSDATILFMQISDLDEGKIEEAKSFMNSRLDSAIMMIDASLEGYPNQETKEHAQKLLIQIAEHRIKYPPSTNENLADLETHVQEILTRALENKKQQNQNTHSITASGGSE